MISDIFVVTGFGLFEPIFAIFINDNIIGGSIFAAGLASTIFIVVKSVLQLPIARYVDSHDHKMKLLIAGVFFISLVPFIYIFSDHIYMIYLAQVVYGIGAAFATPTWLGIWSTHLDKKKEAFEWSVYSTCVGLGGAASATIGAAISEFISFKITFLIVGCLSLLGMFILFALEKDETRKLTIKSAYYHKVRKEHISKITE